MLPYTYINKLNLTNQSTDNQYGEKLSNLHCLTCIPIYPISIGLKIVINFKLFYDMHMFLGFVIDFCICEIVKESEIYVKK